MYLSRHEKEIRFNIFSLKLKENKRTKKKKTYQLSVEEQSSFLQFHIFLCTFLALHLLQVTMVLSSHLLCHDSRQGALPISLSFCGTFINELLRPSNEMGLCFFLFLPCPNTRLGFLDTRERKMRYTPPVFFTRIKESNY